MVITFFIPLPHVKFYCALSKYLLLVGGMILGLSVSMIWLPENKRFYL